MTNLSESFNQLIDAMYENIDGYACERLPDGRYRWRGRIATKSEIQQEIKDAGASLKNSIKEKNDGL